MVGGKIGGSRDGDKTQRTGFSFKRFGVSPGSALIAKESSWFYRRSGPSTVALHLCDGRLDLGDLPAELLVLILKASASEG
jgi:hypothetical protein